MAVLSLSTKPDLAKSDKSALNQSLKPRLVGVFWYDKFMIWKLPPIIKIFETLTVMGDGRITVSGNTAKVISSNGDKTYTVEYNPEANTIVADDNESFWQKRLGYPSLAYLLQTKVVKFNPKAGNLLAGVNWKKLNAANHRDYDDSISKVLSKLSNNDQTLILKEVDSILEQLNKLKIKMPKQLMKPVKDN